MNTFEINKNLQKIGANFLFIVSNPLEDFNGSLLFEDVLEGLSNNVGIKKEFSSSINGEDWEDWQILTQQALETIKPSEILYLKIKWTIVANLLNEIVTIKRFNLNYVSKTKDFCFEEFTLPGLKDSTFDYANIGTDFAKIESDINNYINKASPFEVKYFRTLPNVNSMDVILNEWSLKHTVESKCIKVTLENNELPVDDVNYTEWGTEWEDATIFIDIRYFEETFGPKTTPRNDDFVYFEKYNRMYYVNSNKLKRGIGGVPMYWIIGLKTYENDSSNFKDKDTEKFLEEHTINNESLFGKEILEEMEDTSRTQQNQMKTISQDFIRDEIDEANLIVEETVYNNGNELLKNYYDFTNIEKGAIAISYQKEISLPIDGSIGFANWFKVITNKNHKQFSVISENRIDYITLSITLSDDIKNLKIIDDGFVKIGGISYRVLSVDSTVTIKIKTSASVVGLTGFAIEKFNMIEMLENQFSLDFVGDSEFIMTHNNFESKVAIPALLLDTWYCLIYNLNNKNKKIEFFLYTIDTTPFEKNSSKLKEVYSSTSSLLNPLILDLEQPLIGSSQINYGNLRIFKSSVDKEFHTKLMGVRQIQKASVAFIIDDNQVIFNNRNLTIPIISNKI